MMRFVLAAGALLLCTPAAAEVRESSSNGFLIQLGIDVPASPERTWAMLVKPGKWWDANHSYSGDAANLSIDPRAGGCFCEMLPNPVSPKAAPRGSVEHMRVVYIEEPRALRMSGALGPLQAGAGTGTLTVVLKPQEGGTRVLWEYAYGGYVRGDVPEIAKAVDGVLAGQLLGLAKSLGSTASGAPDAQPVQAQPASPPAQANTSGSDFFSEMETAIKESRNEGPLVAPPNSPGLDAEPPQKTVNEQGYIGR